MRQQKQVEKLLQIAQRKKNQLLGVQPNQELNALIITDESHKKASQLLSGLLGVGPCGEVLEEAAKKDIEMMMEDGVVKDEP